MREGKNKRKRDFDAWLAQLRPSIATYDYYINFAKVIENANTYKAELCLMNSLVGADRIEVKFRELVENYPTVLRCIPSLLAVRQRDIFARDTETLNGVWYDFANRGNTIDDYCVFMKRTGLFDIISKHLVSNLYDYVVGVETGLDSNGRKNRGGDLMENIVELFLKRARVEFYKEMKSKDINSKWGLDLSSLTNKGKTVKKFDFVVRTGTYTYGIETNFYSASKNGEGGGSKLNETARSYKMLALEARKVPRFKFVWITDGAAWHSAKNNLRETFDVLPTLYNIKELEYGIMTSAFSEC